MLARRKSVPAVESVPPSSFWRAGINGENITRAAIEKNTAIISMLISRTGLVFCCESEGEVVFIDSREISLREYSEHSFYPGSNNFLSWRDIPTIVSCTRRLHTEDGTSWSS